MKKILYTCLLVTAYIFSAQAQTFHDTYTITDLAATKGKNKFTFFNFSSGQEISQADSNSTKWDIAFSGTTIIFNGGGKGPGTVSALVVAATSFEALTAAPATAYDLNIISGSGSWYNYNPGANNSGPHTITPIADKIIVVKLSDGTYAKVQILNYYLGAPDDVPTTGDPYTGTPQYYTFRYVTSDPADAFQNTVAVVDLAANKGKNKFTFLNFNSGQQVAVEDSNSTKWDIAFSATTIIFNGGVKGPGTVAAQMVSPTSFEALTEAPSTAYDLNIISGSGSWYNYNPGTNNSGPHTITPIADKIIVAKLTDGRYVKIQILNYYQGAPDDVPTTGAPYTGVSQYYAFRYLISETVEEPVTPTSVFKSANTSIHIYPNPVSSSINKLSVVSDVNGVVRIVDLMGNEVYSSVISQTETQLNNMNLAKGFYMVTLESNGVLYQQKLIVE